MIHIVTSKKLRLLQQEANRAKGSESRSGTLRHHMKKLELRYRAIKFANERMFRALNAMSLLTKEGSPLASKELHCIATDALVDVRLQKQRNGDIISDNEDRLLEKVADTDPLGQYIETPSGSHIFSNASFHMVNVVIGDGESTIAVALNIEQADWFVRQLTAAIEAAKGGKDA